MLLDDVQFKTGSFFNRNFINTQSGPVLLTVPVSRAALDSEIRDVKVANAHWQKKHYNALIQSYSKAPFFKDHVNYIETVYLKSHWESLIDLNINIINYAIRYLRIDASVILSSSLNIETKSSERLVDICRSLNASMYLSGPGGRKYLDEELFAQSDLLIHYQNYSSAPYKTIHREFVPNLCFWDIFMNMGEACRDVIEG